MLTRHAQQANPVKRVLICLDSVATVDVSEDNQSYVWSKLEGRAEFQSTPSVTAVDIANFEQSANALCSERDSGYASFASVCRGREKARMS